MFFTSMVALAAWWQLAAAFPPPREYDSGKASCSTKPPAFFLAGDSMTAVQSAGGGGYGVGFLSFLKSPAWGTDYGKNGATTVSFVSGGYWAKVIDAVKTYSADYDPFVPIMVSMNL